MMLTWGTRGAALHSASVIGLLSGSAQAAARRCFAVMASARLQSTLRGRLAVFFMVASSLSWFGKACRDDTRPLAAYGVGNGKQAPFEHPKQDEAGFSIFLPTILADLCEDIREGKSRRRKAHAMTGEVLRCLSVIPFEIVVSHDTTA